MSNYFKNIGLWFIGWFRFKDIEFKPTWSAIHPKWWVTYLLNIGINVITGGAVQTLSGRMHLHRDGKVNDFVLDILEKFDPQHGEKAMAPIFESVESSRQVQIATTAFWGILLCLVLIK